MCYTLFTLKQEVLMRLSYSPAQPEDIDQIYLLCKALIQTYEQLDAIDFPRVLRWIRQKIESSIGEYTVLCADGMKAGYYHFYRNKDGLLELDDLYLFPPFQNQGIGTAVIQKCCASTTEPIQLYVFARNTRAVALYERLGFQITETVHQTRYLMKR